MKKSNILLGCLLLAFISIQAQTSITKNLEGKIVSSKNKDVADVTIFNLNSLKGTISNAYGYFSIPVQLNDTLVFSSIQFKKKEIVISKDFLKSSTITVYLEEAITELDEVVVTPYNLSGDISRDVESLEIDPVMTAASLGLPNAYLKIPSKAERDVLTAIDPSSVDFIFNALSGRTKELKKILARDRAYARTNRVKAYYPDSLYIKKLHIPKERINDFMYFCEVDINFNSIVDSHDRLKIWGFLSRKSILYREDNGLD